MTPQQALQQIVRGLTGNDPTHTGVFVGTYRHHAVMQEAIECLQEFIASTENAPAAAEVNTDTP